MSTESNSKPFAHLHCHSHYSLLDGAAKVKDLVNQAKKHGMSALALTDHGNLFGAIEFYDTCKGAGLNPVLGYEAYIAPAHRADRQARGGFGGEASFHLTMLAKNRTGFQNLVKLASYAYLEGFYYKPRIDKELLEAHREGLVVLSGCAASEFSSFILNDQLGKATELAEWFAKTFGEENFFIEIQDNGLELQKQCARGAIEVANNLGIDLVATCDTHYICSGDAHAHEVLLCINTGKTMNDPKRMQYGSNEFYLKSPEEMYKSFPDLPGAVQKSQQIADMVDIDLDFSKRHFPVFEPPPGKDDKTYLRDLCEIGLQRRYGEEIPQAAWDRLDLELGVINKLGFASYFLIVWDFVNFSAENRIPCGARGSACGALVSYLLGFSSVDPLEYDLLFERFLDPSRAEAPDIDIDFCQHRREEVIEYVRQKYGEKNVAQIITFGTMAARAVIRDVGRAMEIPLSKVDRIAKMVPTVLKITLEKALEQSPELKQAYDTDPEVRQIIDVGMKLEGLARNPGTHAAGVVVADQDLTNYIPLQKNGDIVTTQWEMSILEKVGMLKVDFLGLRNLTILQGAVDLIQQVRGEVIDPLAFPLDDVETYALLQRGETKGVFQLESEGIRGLLTRMRPDRFQDIIATAALYRPGPLNGGMVDKYVNVKHGREDAEYAHAVMKDVLEETYGVMVYQEQVMRILNRLGGIELADAYKCIKAISKKKFEIIAKYKSKFIEGSVSQGLDAKQAEHIFELIEFFAGYGFNKSHSTAYALVAYQTAFLKAHYPAEFMAALLSSEVDKTDLLVDHIDDCRRMKIEVRPPDISQGEVSFTVVDGVILFGLMAIKGVGEKAIDSIVRDRKKNGAYKNLFDFCERLDTKLVNKACIENLIKAGALDSFGARRAQLMAALPLALQAGASARDAKASGQGLLFEGDSDEPLEEVNRSLPDIPEWNDREILANEKSVLGIYLSRHPLSEHQRTLRTYANASIEEIKKEYGATEEEGAEMAAPSPVKPWERPERIEVVVGGMVTAKRVMVHQKGRSAGQQYCRFMFEDASGSISCVMFADAYAESGGSVVDDRIGFVEAEIDTSRGEVGLIVNNWIDVERAPHVLSGTVVVKLDANEHSGETLEQLSKILKSRPGASSVQLDVLSKEEGLRTRLVLGEGYNVGCDDDLVARLESALGQGTVQLERSRRLPPNKRNGNGNGNGNGHGKPKMAKAGS